MWENSTGELPPYHQLTLYLVQVHELAEQHCAADSDMTGLFQVCFVVHEQLEAVAADHAQAVSAEGHQIIQQPET